MTWPHEPPQDSADDDSKWWVATPDRIALLRARYVRQAFSRHAHETFVVCVNEHGGHVSWYRGRTVTIDERAIAVIPPGEVHSGQPIGGHAWHYRAMYPSTELICALAREVGLNASDLPTFPELSIDDPFLADAFVRAHRMGEEEPDSLAAQAALIDFLTMLLSTHAAWTKPSRFRVVPRDVVRRAIDYIQDSFAERVTLEMLADATGLPRGTMLRAFKLQVGLPPYAFLTQVRIEHAKRLLQEGLPIATVAGRVGFADQSHLNRHFKRLVGVTPGVFARGAIRPT
jgi:AraC-like DNA-binding protein